MTNTDQRVRFNHGAPIFLVGFMGAGKTTIGRALARKLNYKFADLDEEIERRTGKSVREIFTHDGEPEFRRLENTTLCEFAGSSGLVVSLGGGTYIPQNTRQRVKEIGITVWIDCPLEVCWSRVAKDTGRPLLKTYPEMETLLDSRIPAYRDVDIIIQTDSDDPALAVAQILGALTGDSPLAYSNSD